MNRFAVGMARLKQLFLANAAVSIIYHKLTNGVDTAIPLTVWIGNTLFKITDNNNQRMEWGDRDYLIPVELLVVGVIPFLPDVEHWIEEVLPEGNVHYQLSAPEKEPVWRYSDPQHTIYRVHTKRVAS